MSLQWYMEPLIIYVVFRQCTLVCWFVIPVLYAFNCMFGFVCVISFLAIFFCAFWEWLVVLHKHGEEKADYGSVRCLLVQ